MALTVKKISAAATPNEHKAVFVGYGTYTAANFTIHRDRVSLDSAPNDDISGGTGGLGFSPKRVVVTSLTGRISQDHVVDSALDGGNNAKALITVAAGSRTYATSALTVTGQSVAVAVSGLIASNDDFMIEVFG